MTTRKSEVLSVSDSEKKQLDVQGMQTPQPKAQQNERAGEQAEAQASQQAEFRDTTNREEDAFQSEVDEIMATLMAPKTEPDVQLETELPSESNVQGVVVAPDQVAVAAQDVVSEDAGAFEVQAADSAAALESLGGFETIARPAHQAVAAPYTDPIDPPEVAQAMEKRPKKWPLVLLALIVLLLGCYLAGAVAFMCYFMPNTSLNGQDVSLQTTKEVAASAATIVDSFSLEVTGQGLELKLTAGDIKARFDGNAYARAAIHQQRPWLWPFEIASSHKLTVDKKPTYDAVILQSAVESAVDTVNKDATDPVDATISFDEPSVRYTITPEVKGTKLDTAAVLEEVHEALDQEEYVVTLTDDVLVQPAVSSSDKELTEAVEKANSWLGATQELVARNEVVATVGAEDLHKWIELDKDLKVTFDSEACTTWARGELSEKLDTVGSKRSFTTPDGREITVEGGTYGWSINGGEIAEQIADNVQEGKAAQIEVTWLMEAKEWKPGGNEWGDTYIEIDLGAQHVRYYQGGKVTWESDCVSGGMNSGKMHATPTGVYYINSNMESGNVELKGEIDPKTKEPEYISYVKYWMPFLNNSHALHDADWRDSFGGDIYLSNGSHGCVNLPPDKAAELYGMVSVGTVVVVHE